MIKKKMPILSIIGPTSIGKTQLAFIFEKKFPIEIVSVDSAMIYREMDIGTDKPTPQILSKIKHHLIDIKNPDENYNVGDFYQDAHRLINEIHNKKKIPLFVGGTLMYFNQLYYGLNKLPSSSDETRKFINNLAKKYTWETLYTNLKNIDLKSATKITKNDSQRIQRFLEIYLLTGNQPSSFLSTSMPLSKEFNVITIKLITDDRSLLHDKIEQRTKKMFDSGFVDEVISIKNKYNLSTDSKSMKAIGYKQIMSFLDGKLSHDEIIEKTIFATRQLAKRQITWLNKFEKAVQIRDITKIPTSLLTKIEKNLHFL